MSIIITSSKNVEPIYASELINLVPSSRLQTSRLQAILTICYQSSQEEKDDYSLIEIIQRGAVDCPRVLYPYNSKEDFTKSFDENSIYDKIQMNVTKHGARYAFGQQDSDSKELSMYYHTKTRGLRPNSPSKVSVPKEVHINRIAPGGMQDIPDMFWPYTILELQAKCSGTSYSCIRITYDIHLGRYKKYDDPTDPSSLETLVTTVPYELFSPEGVYSALSGREIGAALDDYMATFCVPEAEKEKLEARIALNLREMYNESKEWRKCQDLTFYIYSSVAQCDISGVDQAEQGIELPFFEIPDSIEGHFVKRLREGKAYKLPVRVTLTNAHFQKTIEGLIDQKTGSIVSSLERTGQMIKVATGNLERATGNMVTVQGNCRTIHEQLFKSASLSR